jgi:thymidylate kinase
LAEQAPATLVAVEGIRKADLAAAAKRVLHHSGRPKTIAGVSLWDASGLFFELTREMRKAGYPSPKTLLMLYATDLAFRLRWEIQPALDEGLLVAAAPYVETALAFAAGAGVAADWVAYLFRFAPNPQAVYRVAEKDEPASWRAKPGGGFLEFCCSCLGASSGEWDQAAIRAGFIGYMDKLEKVGRARKVGTAAW